MKKTVFAFIAILLFTFNLHAQQPDKIYMPNIHGVKLFLTGNQDAYPVIKLNAVSSLELHFDDLGGGIKNYNYTYVLCDANWQPANLSPFDYLQGFTQGKLMQYRNSSVAKTKYVHYQATLQIADVTIKPGDIILGDIDGVLVVPRNIAYDVLLRAEEIHENEKRIFFMGKRGAVGA